MGFIFVEGAICLVPVKLVWALNLAERGVCALRLHYSTFGRGAGTQMLKGITAVLLLLLSWLFSLASAEKETQPISWFLLSQ